MISVRHAFVIAAGLVIVFGSRVRAEDKDVFGSRASSQSALIGMIYDLKQDPKRRPTGIVPDAYPAVIAKFLTNKWDESVLSCYFSSVRPLYTTQIFIPEMGAGEAPKAFGVEKIMKPSCWVIHYKGQVSPPSDGHYRFVGCSDDLLAVAVNGETVLIGARMNLPMWKSKEKPGAQAADDALAYGDWILMRKDVPIDLDVLIGERPGGGFNAFLLYQKKEDSYTMDAQGNPILPIFQLAPYDTPASTDPNMAPFFSKAKEVWRAYQ